MFQGKNKSVDSSAATFTVIFLVTLLTSRNLLSHAINVSLVSRMSHPMGRLFKRGPDVLTPGLEYICSALLYFPVFFDSCHRNSRDVEQMLILFDIADISFASFSCSLEAIKNLFEHPGCEPLEPPPQISSPVKNSAAIYFP